MEMIDVLDEHGNKTGEIRSIDDIHIYGLWHQVVHVWVINSDGEIIIHKRSDDVMTDAGLWDLSAGGHVSSGQDKETATLSELEEELGIKSRKEELVYIDRVKMEKILRNGSYIDKEFRDIHILKLDFDITKISSTDKDVSQIDKIHWKELRTKIENGDTTFVSHPDEYKILFAYLKKNY